MKESDRKNECPLAKKCGGCDFIGFPYEEQLRRKQERMRALLSEYGEVLPIIGMADPYHYRNKVHRVFGRDRQNHVLSGFYRRDSHIVVDAEHCLLEDEKSQQIILSVKGLLKSFKIRIYDEDTGTGLLRHVLVRRGFQSGEIMVVLVLSSQILPGKNNFVKALRTLHPEITTIILNVNDQDTSMVLGPVSKTLYGSGFIKDSLCGSVFRISPSSFYQVNPVQTELLYRTALRFAGLTGKELVLDAYSGIGTIGLSAAPLARQVIGVELNRDAVRDALVNVKENRIDNARFYAGDAGEFIDGMVKRGEKADVVFLDPPRSGSTEKFLRSAASMKPSRIVYISCGPETLARDLGILKSLGYRAERIQPVDMFPWTEHVECVVLLTKYI